MPIEQEFLTMKEAASYLRINYMTLMQWVQRGKIETVQIVPKGKRLISKETIEKLVRARTVKESLTS